MWQKIKSNYKNIGYWLILIGLLIITRFIGLDWGLPYPFHPDERNIAVALQQLSCDFVNLKECFHPHFFAYGQLPLYLGYLLIFVFKLIFKKISLFDFGKFTINFEEATLTLRLISAFLSVWTGILIIKIIKIVTGKKPSFSLVLLLIFSPFTIQYAHFGTTEAMLMFFYVYLIYISLLFVKNEFSNIDYILRSGFILGLSMATKISSATFVLLPAFLIVIKNSFFKKHRFLFLNFLIKLFDIFFLIFVNAIFFVIFSPHNFIKWKDFLSSIQYESDVGLGRYVVFYTKQFDQTIPIVFQLIKVIPYAVGGIGIIGLIGLISQIGQIRQIGLIGLIGLISLIGLFLPNALIFAKWTRFLAAFYPVLLISGIIFLERIKVIKVIKVITVIFLIIPGIFYFSIYLQSDIRFQASDWIYQNIPENSYILSETANVVDLPIISPKSKIKNQKSNRINKEKITNYQMISFDFYNLDNNPSLQEELTQHLKKADYIIVPSRRIFANYTCYWPDENENIFDKIVYEKDRCDNLKKEFPILNEYYKKLFNEELGFKLVKKFSVFPFNLDNKFLEFFNDERAEETLTVFDHPTVRIYKKSQNAKVKSQKL